MNVRRHVKPTLLMMLIAAVALAGCSSTQVVPERPLHAADACAEHLHELAGALLLYYSTNGRLPESLGELRALGVKDLNCPVSGLPYEYFGDAAPLSDRPGRLIVRDAAPVHNGGRWGIVLLRNSPDAPITADVVWFGEED